MKLTKVIIVCNENPLYYQFANDIYDIWEKYIKIEPHLFIIAQDKSSINLDLGNRRVQFIKPVSDVPTAFQSQVIRLLLPCLFKDDYSIITDIDMIPINKKMFRKYLKYIDDDIFIQFFQNYQICYNCAKGDIWNNIFNINSIKEIKVRIHEWYQKYNGIHTTDQLILRDALQKYKGKTLILTSYLPNKTVIKRLSSYNDANIVKNIRNEELNQFVDFHVHDIFKDESNIPYYKQIINHILKN